MADQLSAISAGDVHRIEWPSDGEEMLPLYQGSGRAGACWNRWGLMDTKGADGQPTVWSHADHWHHGHFGMDGWLHVGRLGWEGAAPEAPHDYGQSLTLIDGRLTTTYKSEQGSYRFTSSFDPGRPDLLAFEIEYDFVGGFPALLFEASLGQNLDFIGSPEGTLRCEEERDGWRLLQLKVGTSDTLVALRIFDLEGHSSLVTTEVGIRIGLGTRGRHLLVLGCAGAQREVELKASFAEIEPASFAEQSALHWRKRWGTAWIHLPDPQAQALWARSHFYMLASYGADVRSPAAPMGWAGSAWPYGFPQDLAFIHPALLRLGHVDIPKAWVEFYARTIPIIQDMTKRVFGLEGTMWAWEYPIAGDQPLFVEGVPHKFQYEIHNAAYPGRMAYETALHLRDPAWSRDIAWPVVRESARFFASGLRRAKDGVWDLRVKPSMGQDEIDEEGGSNYLCSLFAARHALRIGINLAVELGLEDEETLRWRGILADGLAFRRLVDANTGLYATREGIRVSDYLGKQKHPIQLNPLYCAPQGEIDAPTWTAVRRRLDICVGLGKGASQGWTVHANCLAAAHAGDGEGFLSDLHLAGTDHNVDAEWLQIYECAPFHKAFYITSHGLYLQAVQDILVSDYFGDTEFGTGCPESWQEIQFAGLRTFDGKSWSGAKTATGWTIKSDA